MNATYRLFTVAAMLLHSIFGCGFHHSCADAKHVHQAHRQVEPTALCDAHHCHGHADTDRDVIDHQRAAVEMVAASFDDGCQQTPCPGTPCPHGETPCCSVVQCSFIGSSGFTFSVDVGQVGFAAADTDASLARSSRGRLSVDGVRSGIAPDDSLSRCALHCSWQI
ncbi:hypothetical protein NZK35_31310 [Stieleria sp. ICT_E10.1]|uniref:hypothetical protein n=1 Tax=Stieleria sedimenti TaxID=2976331 RepID=UPI00217FE5DA|nr:hypothetical protein [Stieleria sedimenti]MCS7471169.1 hypothetical protein [Stieleria sedimenti]